MTRTKAKPTQKAAVGAMSTQTDPALVPPANEPKAKPTKKGQR
jgi:hypothetical protein